MKDARHPHLLFDDEKMALLQTQLLDQLLGEVIVYDGTDRNIPEYKEIEEVLFHLATTFARNSDDGDTLVKVPSVKLLHVLFTVAAKPYDGRRGDIITNYLPGDVTVHKLHVREISLLMLRRYLLVITAADKEDDSLYNSFITVVQQIIRRKSTFTSHQLGNKPKLSPQSPRKRDIISLMKKADQSESESEIVSDSDSEGDVLKTSIEEEVMRYKDYFLSPTKSASSRSLVRGKASDLFKNVSYLSSPGKEDVVTDIDSSPTKPRSKARSLSPAKKGTRSSSPGRRMPRSVSPLKPVPLEEELHHIKITDELLLASQLRNTPNYNLWKLLQWTLICAERSSNSGSFNNHLIYRSYSAFFHFLVDFLTFNLTFETERLFSEQTSSRRSTVIKLIFMDSRILLLLLMSHLSTNTKEWSDRAVEFIFTGLNIETTFEPQPLYEREKALARRDRQTNENLQPWNDNMDSMSLRSKVITLLYYRLELMKQMSEECGAEIGLFIRLTSSKLMIIDIPLFEAFFEAPALVGVPDRVYNQLVWKLMNQILSEITQLVELYDYFVEVEESNQNKVDKFSQLIVQDDLYSWSEDDQDNSNWSRLNYILVYMMNRVMSEVDDKQSIEQLRSAGAAADGQRKKYGTDFVLFTDLHDFHFGSLQ